MNRSEESKLDREVEKKFSGHRGLQNGRDFRWNVFRYRDDPEDLEDRWNKTFTASPGSPEWWEQRERKLKKYWGSKYGGGPNALKKGMHSGRMWNPGGKK